MVYLYRTLGAGLIALSIVGSASARADHHRTARASPNAPHRTIVATKGRDDYIYAPRIMTVRVGTAVTWVNRSAVEHDLTFLIGRRFDRDFGRGKSITLVFSHPGTFVYYCDLHAGMVGVVIVKPR